MLSFGSCVTGLITLNDLKLDLFVNFALFVRFCGMKQAFSFIKASLKAFERLMVADNNFIGSHCFTYYR